MHQGYAHSYHYDNDAKLNVVKNEKGMVMPFVDLKDDKLCISTKTEALRESDDTANEMLLISTKTRAEMESDDEGSFCFILRTRRFRRDRELRDSLPSWSTGS